MPYIQEGAERAYPAIYSCYLDLQLMVRTDTHKLIVYPKLNKILLFDLINDPQELRDVSKDSNYRDIREELVGLLLERQREFNDALDLGHILAADKVTY